MASTTSEQPLSMDTLEGALREEQINLAALLFNDTSYSDLKILCRDKTFHVHKAILGPRCKFFQACIASGFMESETSAITMNDDDPSAMKSMLEFLYTTSVRAFDHKLEACKADDYNHRSELFSSLGELFIICDKYHVESLSKYLSIIFSTELALDWKLIGAHRRLQGTALAVLRAARRLDDARWRSACDRLKKHLIKKVAMETTASHIARTNRPHEDEMLSPGVRGYHEIGDELLQQYPELVRDMLEVCKGRIEELEAENARLEGT